MNEDFSQTVGDKTIPDIAKVSRDLEFAGKDLEIQKLKGIIIKQSQIIKDLLC